MAHNPGWIINKYPKDLKAQIKELTSKGYVVTVQDQTTAQLVRRKRFSCLIATLSFCFFAVGFFLYLFYFLAQRDDTIYLDLSTQEYDPDWKEKEARSKKNWRIGIAALFLIPITIISISGFVADLINENTPTSQTEASTVPYTIVSGETDSVIIHQAVVITPENATKENIEALVAQWREDYALKSIVGIAIFTDVEMAIYFQDAVSGIPDAISEKYDSAYIAQYNKNENTGFEVLQLHLAGLDGDIETINF